VHCGETAVFLRLFASFKLSRTVHLCVRDCLVLRFGRAHACHACDNLAAALCKYPSPGKFPTGARCVALVFIPEHQLTTSKDRRSKLVPD
jgi:hypothetical protein